MSWIKRAGKSDEQKWRGTQQMKTNTDRDVACSHACALFLEEGHSEECVAIETPTEEEREKTRAIYEGLREKARRREPVIEDGN